MTLSLKPVEATRGSRWIGDAWRLFAKKPLAFSALFAIYLFAGLLVAALVPLVGGLAQMMSIPLLSLGFMVASQSALLDGPVHPRQFIEPLRSDRARRRSLLILCAIYGVALVGIVLLTHGVSGGAMQRIEDLRQAGKLDPESAQAILSEPGVSTALLMFALLGVLLSVPFWHAPALVHWGGQSVAQALFSSTVAVWRSKGAFFLYGLTWIGQCIMAAFVILIVPRLLGLAALGPVLLVPAMLVFSTVFYVSLLFSFNDSFGGKAVPPMDDDYTRPDAG
jgi:hypothetical protein